ncbi:unnamed protein product [Calypogeia fissa]
MTIKIFGSVLSGRTARVLAVLFEKDVTDFELVPVSFDTSPEEIPEFLKTQPFGQTPVLVDGPLILFESRAIARYIAEKFEGQGTALYGTSLTEKALVEQWLEYECHKFNPPIAVISRENLLKVARGGCPDKAIVEANIVKLGKVLDVYNEHLAKSKYLAGDFFSLADACHLPYIEHLIDRSKRGDVIDSRPHVKAWWADISSRPAWKKVSHMIHEEMHARWASQDAQKSLEKLEVK